MTTQRDTPRYTVQVELSVLAKQQTVLVVLDEADMKRQIAEREAALRSAPFTANIQQDKKGNPILHQLNKDWNV